MEVRPVGLQTVASFFVRPWVPYVIANPGPVLLPYLVEPGAAVTNILAVT